jgi:protein-tyrosine-phosphatase
VNHILFVCNRNQFRSPVSAELLRNRLTTQNVAAEVHSAGLCDEGRTLSGDLVRALRDRGIDLLGRRSHRLGKDDVQRADLVLTMEHHHAAEVAVLDPAVWSRTFTLKEVLRRSASAGRRARDEPLDQWLARVSAGRTRLEQVGAWRDDIADPVGRSLAEVERTVDELEDLISQLVEVAWPSGRRRGAPTDKPPRNDTEGGTHAR